MSLLWFKTIDLGPTDDISTKIDETLDSISFNFKTLRTAPIAVLQLFHLPRYSIY